MPKKVISRSAGENWSAREVKVVVLDYFDMLRSERLGQSYNKSDHRRRLVPQLDGRTEAAVEMKHRNISAVLAELGVTPIRGYKPLPNHQQLLADEVAQTLARDPSL